ncbi:uncharacterized protein DNG_02164 [Cephalotrichum gorgonifer]|uniref:Uncharacterized protein n=1 Tax=Cephalotrichum gorgonifer TaxID=2041049 RepID=A0AAE8MUD9_9PEZI|nr:uncharacterized protein DNG_02164 [Cephalotrichum gorgonifer]
MTPFTIYLATIGLAFHAWYAAGLSVASGSPCEALCASSDGSAARDDKSDVVCQDDQFSTTEKGKRFKECITCLKDNNLRFVIDTCLFDDEIQASAGASDIAECLSDEACLPLDGALTFDSLEIDPNDMYGYCTAADKAFVGGHMRSCLTCLESSANHVFLSNFMVVLTGGCAYKPVAGSTLGFTGDVFSDEGILIESPGSRQDGDEDHEEPAEGSSPPPKLSREFIIGIVVGISVLFAFAITLFFIYYLRFRKREQPDSANPRFDRYLRHQESIDADPALFNSTPHGTRLYPYGSDSDDDAESMRVFENNNDYFDYMNATAMMQKPQVEGLAPPAHAAYNPYIRSGKRFVGEVDRSTSRMGRVSGAAGAGEDDGEVSSRGESRGPSPFSRT